MRLLLYFITSFKGGTGYPKTKWNQGICKPLGRWQWKYTELDHCLVTPRHSAALMCCYNSGLGPNNNAGTAITIMTSHCSCVFIIKSLSVGIGHLNLTRCNYGSVSSTFSQRITESYFCHRDERGYFSSSAICRQAASRKIKLSVSSTF